MHHISWAATRAGPAKRVRCLMGCAERPIGSQHLMGRVPARPISFEMMGRWPGLVHPLKRFQTMGRGPAEPIKILDGGPQPSPAHSIFEVSRPGSVHHFFKFSARPGPAHHIFKMFGPPRPGPAHHHCQMGPARPGLDHRPMTSSALTMLLARSMLYRLFS